jgi:large repetitive protein
MNKIFRVRIITRDNDERWFELDASGRNVLKIRAAELQRIELLRKSTGFAPDVIKGRREGDDLHIDLMDSAESFEHLVIEGYYGDEAAAAVQGLTEGSAVYGYMPMSGDPGFRISSLLDGVSGLYALGTNAASNAALGGVVASAFPMTGWWSGIGAAALAGAGGGSSAASSAQALPLAAASIREAWFSGRQLEPGEAAGQRPTLRGAAPAEATRVEIFDGDQKVGEATVSNGNWTFTPDQPWPTGVRNIRVRAVNEAQISSWSESWPMLLADARPSVPAIQSVLDDVGPIQGALQQHQPSDDSRPVVTGTAMPGTWVIVWVDGVAQSPAVLADANGRWQFELPEPLSAGEHRIAASARNVEGQEGPRSGERIVFIDTEAPAAVVFVVADDVGAVPGVVPGGGVTDDATPTVSGQNAQPGDLVVVSSGNVILGSAVVGPDGRWSVTPTVALSDGAHTLSVVAQDAAGNRSAPSTQTLTIDTRAQPVAITRAEDNQDPVTGQVADGGTGNDSTPTLVGTGRPGQVVTLSVGSTVLGSATVGTDGIWRFEVPALGADANYTFRAQALDAQGNPSQHDFGYTLDRSAPAAPSNISVLDDVGAVQGSLSSGGVTDDTTPTVSGTGATPGELITLYDNGTPLASVVVGPSGAWSLTPAAPGLSEGPHTLTLTATDAAGNESAPSAPIALTVDTTAPDAPLQAVRAVDDVDVAQDPIPQGGVTDDSRPTFSGVAPAGAQTMRIYDNGVLLGTALVDGSGNWSFTPESPLADGEHTVRAAPVDAAGNIGAPGPDLVFELRGDAPNVPTITAVDDNVEGLSGLLQKGQSTNDPTPTVSGTGVPGSTVVLSANGSPVGSAVVGADGRWSVTPNNPLATGTQTFTAVATLGGVSSAPTGGYPVVIDTTPPTAPAAPTITDDQGAQTGPVTGGQSTDDATPTFSGTGATPGDLITVYANGQPVASAVVDGSGNWSATPTEPLRDGAHAISVTATDAAGNESDPSPVVNITLDTRNAGVQIYHALDEVPGVTGQVADGGVSNDTTPTLVGRAEPGALVTITEGGTTLGSAVADLGGFWQVPLPVQSPGPHTYTATAVLGGNTSNTSFVLSIDTTPPAAPSNISVLDDVGAVQGSLSSGGVTDDTTPTVSGTGATPGELITLYDNGTPLASVVVGPSGAWSLTPAAPGLSEGPHTLTLTATDAAGNESAPSAPIALTVDTTAPNAPSAAVPLLDDVGFLTGPLGANALTDDARPALNIGVVPAGLAPVYLVDGVPVAASYDPGTGLLTPDAAIPDGPHTVAYAWRDPAGNTSAPSPSTAITVDTQAPATTATIVSAADDVGIVTTPVANGGVTDDTRPTLSGTLSQPLAAGETLRMYSGSTYLGDATVSGNNWSFEVPLALAHSHGDTPSYSARVADAAGNLGTPSNSYGLTIDTQAPTTTTVITAITDNAGIVTGTVASGGVTDDTSLVLSGTVAQALLAGEVLRVYDGSTYLGDATVTGTNWSFSDPRTLSHNQSLSYTARVGDTAGNQAPPSNTYSATIDTQAPVTTAAVGAIQDNAGVFTGTVTNGGVTDDTSLLVSGTLTQGLAAGETVRVYDGSTYLGNATVTGTDWTFSDPRTLSHDQTVSYTAQVADAVGNQSAAGAPYTATVDTQAPATTATIVSAADDVGIVTTPVANGGVTDDTRPTLSGTLSQPLAAGETLRMYNGSTYLGDATVSGSNWSFEVPQALAHSHGDTPSYSARVADAAGNLGTPSNSYGLTIDTQAPTTTTVITAITDNAGIVTGTVASGGVTDDTSLVLSGTVAQALLAGEVLRVYDGSTYLGNATVTGTDWSFSDPRTLSHNQSLSYTARVGDTAGNQAPPSNTYSATIDTQAPATTTTITGADDNVGPATGNVASGGATNDTTPTLSGSLSAPLAAGETVRVYNGGTYVGNAAIAVGATAWTFDVPALAHGDTPSFTARVTDAVGNEGSASNAYALAIDTQAPTNATTTITPADVTADNIVNSDEVTGGLTLTGTVVGTFREGDVITLDVNGTLYSTTVAASGAYAVAVTGADLLNDTDRSIGISLQASDAASNVGTVTATKTYLVNAAPVDGDETPAATEGQAFTPVNLLDNASDADSDAMTVTVNSTTGTYAALVTVTNGVLSVNTADASLNALAAGATSQVVVNYTVGDGRGGSNTSTATVTITGANDAPTVSTTSVGNNSALYATRQAGVNALSVPGINGAPAANTAPAGWTAGNSPDINDYSNTTWAGTYDLSNLDGVSSDGGSFVNLVSQAGGYTEWITTNLTSLTVNATYRIAVEWQQITLMRVGGGTDNYSGGQLLLFTDSVATPAVVYNSFGLADGWQRAIYTFTATQTTHELTVTIDGVNGIAGGFNNGAIVVDSLTVAQYEPATYVRSNGTTVATLFPAANVADADTGGFLRGYAITSAANGTTGGWEYSPDGGGNWFSLSTASLSNAFYLLGTDRVRYTGLIGSNTRLDMVMVDNTGPAPHGANLQATTIDVNTRGGTTPFSADVVTLAANAAPVLIDLDGDGRISYSTITGDINLDGLDDQANWVAANDGILFHDKLGDGQLHSMDQFAFAQYGGNTDLEGLAIAFDGNQDGVFDAQDAAFGGFKVWQDLNQDGAVDGGELHSLLSLGITAIALKSDGVQRSPVAGVTEHGHSQATLANGGALLVVDASLDYQHGADLAAQAAEAERVRAASVI